MGRVGAFMQRRFTDVAAGNAEHDAVMGEIVARFRVLSPRARVLMVGVLGDQRGRGGDVLVWRALRDALPDFAQTSKERFVCCRLVSPDT